MDTILRNLRLYGPQGRRHTFFTASHSIVLPKPPLPPTRLVPKDETRARSIVPPPDRPPTAWQWRRAVPMLVLILVWSAACRNANPAAPTTQTQESPTQQIDAPIQPTPDLHNTPATLDADVLRLQPGSIVRICVTQLRAYVTPGGQRTWERDVYISAAPCPETPIN